MAGIRLRTRFHAEGQRSPVVLASVVATLAWKLAIESINNMRRAKFDIDIGPPYFDFLGEFLVFMAVAADRIVYKQLDVEVRTAFTVALVKRLSEIVEENKQLHQVDPSADQRDFIHLFNRRSAEYAEFDYEAFGFHRYLGACLREVLLLEKDHHWVIDQVMDIEAPAAILALEKTLTGILE
ncbi:MAG: hypothetical protein Q8O31_06895 [Rhodocyclaceae bacterium]|nr:hypothetical protein [Rhodocyclaceae bacterium]